MASALAWILPTAQRPAPRARTVARTAATRSRPPADKSGRRAKRRDVDVTAGRSKRLERAWRLRLLPCAAEYRRRVIAGQTHARGLSPGARFAPRAHSSMSAVEAGLARSGKFSLAP